MMKLTVKHYLIIFMLFVLVNVLSSLILNTWFTKINDDNNVAILFNLRVLNNEVSEMQDIIKSNASKVKLRDRLDPDLVAEFGDDDAFLQKIAILKKQIVRRRLESEAIKLENDKIARSNTGGSDIGIYDSLYTNVASKIFEVMMINSSSGIATIRTNDNVVNVKEGDNIKNFIVRKINPDSIVMGRENEDDEVLLFNYLSHKLYQEKKDDKSVEK